ncbi:uncharacterized protein G2W53_026412 [Senna tora]|uniref:Uncharacterized protein n=1 Tax=Senna tora TaxID=362788 RepID=A0A834WFM9_9FABA|nr:uncharacterized protein G2W53_026412 [Senna tora]
MLCQIGLLERVVLVAFPKEGSLEECSLLVKMVEQQVGLHEIVVSLVGLVVRPLIEGYFGHVILGWSGPMVDRAVRPKGI